MISNASRNDRVEAHMTALREKSVAPTSPLDQKNQNNFTYEPNGWVRNSEALENTTQLTGRQTVSVVDFAHPAQRVST